MTNVKLIGAFAIAVSLSALTWSTVLAAEPGKPSISEIRRTTACIAQARTQGTPMEACIGKVSEPCLEQPGGGSTAGMRDCADREYHVWDRLLNARYKRLRKALSKGSSAKLRDVQRIWIKWRNAKCQFPYALFEGGTMAGPMASECMMRTTARRTIELGYSLEAVGIDTDQ